MKKNLFDKYYSKLAKESWLKSILCGLSTGFGLMAVSALVFWFFGVKEWWISLVILAVASAAASVVFFYAKFRPTVADIARRVDDLGLEERMITMTELENDQSFIAMKQREDAMEAMKKADARFIKLVIPVAMFVVLGVSAVFGAGMLGVQVGVAMNKLPSGTQIIEDITKEPIVEYEVIYEVESGEGLIEGDVFQLVEKGMNATAVMAVADEGWAFVQWTDGYTEAYREDIEVIGNMTIGAVFMEAGEGEPGEGEGEGEGEGDPSGEGEGEGEGEGDGADTPSDQPGEGEGEGEGEGDGEGNGAGGAMTPSDNILDNNTNYGDNVYDNYYDQSMDRVNGNDEMPDELKDIIKDYYEAIEK